MSRARDLSKLANPSVFSVDTSNNIGVNSTSPDAKLDVVGIVSATAFYGDGSNLEGVASAGLGTALGEEGGLEVIYYTDNVLTVGSTITVDPPSTTNVAYTQYTEIAVSGDADLIVADGDDLVPDILGLSTEGVSPIVGSGGRVRADNFTSHSGNGAPTFPNGANVTGVVTATSGSFSGNVSVGGTLTYEDVTNVDSVGMITARKGIQVLADGVNVSGVVTATSFSGDGSNLTGVSAGGVADFVASGAISSGDTVVINTDGTVGIVTRSGSDTPSFGTHSVFEQESTEYTATVYDTTNNKVVVAYRDAANSNYGTAVVGTVSGSSITFGTPQVFKTASSEHIAATFDSDAGKVVIFWRDQSSGDYGKAIVGTVSGTSITFGSEVTFESAATDFIGATFDTTNNKVVVVYRDGGDSNQGKTRVGTVSGTSISFGTAVTHETGDSRYNAVTFDSTAGKVVLGYRDQGDSYHGKARVGTVSGTSITYGNITTFANAATEDIVPVYDSANNKTVMVYMASGDGDKGKAKVGTISGTTISFGSEVIWHANQTQQICSVYDSVNSKVVITYRDGANGGHGTANIGTVSGSTISFSSDLVFESANTTYYSLAYDPDSEQAIVSYKDIDNSNYGTSVTINATSLVTNLTTENYIGIAAVGISSGATGQINIVSGINTSQTGLTTGRTYYVQNGGGISTVAGNPSVVAGTSISATKIIVKG